jgi:hypothetical protein
MMRELTALTVIMTVVGIGVLAGVYVWSGDSGRRTRAWRLIQLLLSRRAARAPRGRTRA